MLKVTEIAFSCYAVTDIKRSRDFYEGVLGLKPTTIIEAKWVEYEFGPMRWPSAARRECSIRVPTAAPSRWKWKILMTPSRI